MVPRTHPHPASDSGLVAKVKAKAKGGTALRRHCCSAERIDPVEATPVEAQPRQSAAKQVERTGAESVRRSKATLSPSSWADQRRAGQSRADQKPGRSKAEQIKSRSRDVAFPLRTSPLSKGGHGWVGGTICRHGWRHMSLHGRTCSGSRQPTRARPSQGESSTEGSCSEGRRSKSRRSKSHCSNNEDQKKDGARRRRLTSTQRLGESKPRIRKG
ncbi:hypothetical protein M2412_001774 [Stenotrophomonas rhizophila]|uniref:Uncharacterized protein n=1 Tax=Stenotrophomonas rhizophila TaxID=216778 RepID=A0AAW5PGF0_9GAMM|nr:hypothetical protein [Stenotrophomonas rhizophila]